MLIYSTNIGEFLKKMHANRNKKTAHVIFNKPSPHISSAAPADSRSIIFPKFRTTNKANAEHIFTQLDKDVPRQEILPYKKSVPIREIRGDSHAVRGRIHAPCAPFLISNPPQFPPASPTATASAGP